MVLHAEVMGEGPVPLQEAVHGRDREHGSARGAKGGSTTCACAVRTRRSNPSASRAKPRDSGVMRSVPIGQDALHVLDAQQFYDFLCERDRGGSVVHRQRTARRGSRGARTRARRACDDERCRAAVTLPPDAPMEEIVRALWMVRRDIVSDGYDAALVGAGGAGAACGFTSIRRARSASRGSCRRSGPATRRGWRRWTDGGCSRMTIIRCTSCRTRCRSTASSRATS